MESIRPFDYIVLTNKDIIIVRYNNKKEKYVLGSLIYLYLKGNYKKIKPFNSPNLTDLKNAPRFPFAEKNVFIVKYTLIKEVIKSQHLNGNQVINSLLPSGSINNIRLFGSRILFKKTSLDTDYDFLVKVSSENDIFNLYQLNKQSEGLIKYGENYFKKRAKNYADVSFTNEKSLFQLTKHTLTYFYSPKYLKEIAFFPYFESTESEETTNYILEKILYSNLKIAKIEGTISKNSVLTSFSFPRVLTVTTKDESFNIYSFLWRLLGIGYLSKYQNLRIKIKGFYISDKEIWLGGENTYWELI